MMRYLWILLLTGCSSMPNIETVYVPVNVPCVSAVPDKPESEFDKAKGKSIFDQVKALLIDRENGKVYEAQLEAQLEGCR